MATTILSPHKEKEGSVSLPRDALFSSYLNANDREFVRNLTESIHIFTPAQDASSPGISMGRKPIPRSELGVFRAERYFNEKIDNQRSPTSRKDDRGQRSTQRHKRDKKGENVFDSKSSKSSSSSSLKSPTPNLKSQGSWNKNNQIGFFLSKKASVVLRILSGFRSTGLCFDKKSVYTATTTTTTTTAHQTTLQPPKHNQQSNVPRKRRVSHDQKTFAFPIIDTISPKHNHSKIKVLQDQPRKSLEVFGSSHQLGKEEIEKSIERKLSILTWDAIPNTSPNTAIPFPNTKNNNNPTRKADDDEEVEDVRISDASSDLFEIDNLSGIDLQGIETSTTTDISSCKTLMTHHDAPSEASIEWSVVTASLAEVSPVSDDHNNNNNNNNDNNNEKIAKIGRKVQRNSIGGSSSSTGLLLGCRNQKAVDVVRDNICAKNNASKIRNLQSDKGSPDIAPSTPSRRSSSGKATMKNYVLAYA